MQRPQIDYAPAPPHQKRRRIARRVVIGAVVLIAAILAVRIAPDAWRRIQILYWQRQAMNYAPPPDHVVYDGNPADQAKLRPPKPALSVGGGGELFEFARPWDRLYQLISPPGRQAAATLFLHKMSNSKGEPRLVVIECGISGAPNGWLSSGFRKYVFRPGDLLAEPQVLSSGDTDVSVVASKSRWFAGQSDPNDATHFTIRGVVDGRPISMDGWLRDDWVDLRPSP